MHGTRSTSEKKKKSRLKYKTGNVWHSRGRGKCRDWIQEMYCSRAQKARKTIEIEYKKCTALASGEKKNRDWVQEIYGTREREEPRSSLNTRNKWHSRVREKRSSLNTRNINGTRERKKNSRLLRNVRRSREKKIEEMYGTRERVVFVFASGTKREQFQRILRKSCNGNKWLVTNTPT
jgi:hypothetical protein